VSNTVAKYKSFAASLLHNPDDTQSLVDQFALLTKEGKRYHNRHYYHLAKRAYDLKPDRLETIFNYAGALEHVGRFKEALDLYQKCLPICHAEFMPQLLHDIGVSHRGLGNNPEAIRFYEAAIELDPKATFKRDRAISMMAGATMGTHSLVEGLKAFEARRQCAKEKFAQTGRLSAQQRLPDNAVHWQGENLTGKSVVVYHEEGIGDFIQFCRFLPKLSKIAAEVRLTGPAPEILDLVADNISIQGIVPLDKFDCDYVIGSMTLPWRMGVEYEDLIPDPYIFSAPASIPRRGDLMVGLVWRGSPIYLRDHMRSMPFETMAPLFELPGVAYYSLQIGEPSMEITHLGFDGFVADLQPFMKTWRQTARVISALDVVVTVDTAVAHLAGAMGKPVVIMVTNGCDWRWDRNSDRTAWYSSARVTRQLKQDDWTPCIEYAKVFLKEMLDGRRQAIGATGKGESGKLSVAG